MECLGYANGIKEKTVHPRVGDITVSIPQVREGGFYPGALEKALRSGRTLLLALTDQSKHLIESLKKPFTNQIID